MVILLMTFLYEDTIKIEGDYQWYSARLMLTSKQHVAIQLIIPPLFICLIIISIQENLFKIGLNAFSSVAVFLQLFGIVSAAVAIVITCNVAQWEPTYPFLSDQREEQLHAFRRRLSISLNFQKQGAAKTRKLQETKVFAHISSACICTLLCSSLEFICFKKNLDYTGASSALSITFLFHTCIAHNEKLATAKRQ